MRELVVHFSRKGYVEKLALAKAAALGADVVKLETTERTQGILGFWWCGRFGMHRWEMALKPLPVDVAAYNRVHLFSPIWVFTYCAPVRAFATVCKGLVKQAEYTFVHFSLPMNYSRCAASLDRRLGVENSPYTSVVCMWGKILRQKRFAKGETGKANVKL